MNLPMGYLVLLTIPADIGSCHVTRLPMPTIRWLGRT